jgi:4-hydroxymandelate oxidase
MLRGALNLRELEQLAQPPVTTGATFGYYRSGANDEFTLRDNQAAFQRWQLRPRLLVDVSRVSTSVSLFGRTLASPILVAPMAAQRMAHTDGELGMSRAAAAAGCGFCLSTLSTSRLEDVSSCGGMQWFQLYVFRTRSVTEALVRRAQAAGFKALVVTVDAPLLGRREADERQKFQLSAGIRFENLVEYASVKQTTVADADGSGIASYFVQEMDPALTWSLIAWLKTITTLPILVKGILTPEDALEAVRAGVSGICVSNHGGRQLDGVSSAIDALPAIAKAVRGRVVILLDGGIRRGTDVLKALALGASAVMLGRPCLWALALDGQAGVEAALRMLNEELRLAMALCGVTSLPLSQRTPLVQPAPWAKL